jgi:release factor glutamine methyltransferase
MGILRGSFHRSDGRLSPLEFRSSPVKVIALLRRLAHFGWSLRVRQELRRTSRCSLYGLDLEVAPGVLHPRLFASSRILAESLIARDLKNLRVADVGTGSGLLGLLAARAGARVIAVDVNPVAVDCARRNSARNRLSERIEIAVSDLLDGVQTETPFDLIVTNPPFYARSPGNVPDHAFAAGLGHTFMRRLTAALPSRLSKTGVLLLVHSSDTDFSPIAEMLDRAGFAGRTVQEHRGFFETLTVREFRAI